MIINRFAQVCLKSTSHSNGLMLTAPQLEPRNVSLTSLSSDCVQMNYMTVQYPNAPISQIVYQVNYV